MMFGKGNHSTAPPSELAVAGGEDTEEGEGWERGRRFLERGRVGGQDGGVE